MLKIYKTICVIAATALMASCQPLKSKTPDKADYPIMTELTDSTFDDVLSKTKIPVIVDFYAEWCGPCNRYKPIFEEAAKKYKGKMRFAEANTSENQEHSNKYKVEFIPTTIIFSKGEEKKKKVGAMDKQGLESFIESYLEGEKCSSKGSKEELLKCKLNSKF
ncbi:MAG: thioredoxin [Candidatus Woesearchaeota archaeon]